MKTIKSMDGTTIAFDQCGEGPAIILVDGALGHRTEPGNRQLAALLAAHFTVFCYDRRGRGDSGDLPPYAVEREIEDIDALIGLAGGNAFLFGMSSGAILALRAASTLKGKVTKLALYEPPFILDDSRPPLPADYVERLNAAVANNDRAKAVEIFMTQAILIPEAYLEAMRSAPMWPDMEAVAHTLAYDGLISRDFMRGSPWEANTWAHVAARTLVITGENSEPFFHAAAKALVNDLAEAQTCTLAGQDHNVAMDILAPVLIAFFRE